MNTNGKNVLISLFQWQTLLQKHVGQGKYNTSEVVNLSVFFSTILMIFSFFIFHDYFPTSLIPVYIFLWALCGSIITYTQKIKGILEILMVLPAYVYVILTSYIMCGVYWLIVKIFDIK